MSGRARQRPGPSSYDVGELVEVKLALPSDPTKRTTYYPARVISRSRTYLGVRVVGSGSEIALTRWDTRLFVRRPGEQL